MQDRAEIIWNTYAKLRSDVLLSDRCSSVCNQTLVAFVGALAGAAPEDAAPHRYLGDDILFTADRTMERLVTGMI